MSRNSGLPIALVGIAIVLLTIWLAVLAFRDGRPLAQETESQSSSSPTSTPKPDPKRSSLKDIPAASSADPQAESPDDTSAAKAQERTTPKSSVPSVQEKARGGMSGTEPRDGSSGDGSGSKAQGGGAHQSHGDSGGQQKSGRGSSASPDGTGQGASSAHRQKRNQLGPPRESSLPGGQTTQSIQKEAERALELAQGLAAKGDSGAAYQQVLRAWEKVSSVAETDAKCSELASSLMAKLREYGESANKKAGAAVGKPLVVE